MPTDGPEANLSMRLLRTADWSNLTSFIAQQAGYSTRQKQIAGLVTYSLSRDEGDDRSSLGDTKVQERRDFHCE